MILERYVTFGEAVGVLGFVFKKAGVTFREIGIFSKMHSLLVGEVRYGITSLFAWIFFFSLRPFLSGEYLKFLCLCGELDMQSGES